MGFSLEQVAISSSRELSNPEIEPWSPGSPALAGRFLSHCATGTIPAPQNRLKTHQCFQWRQHSANQHIYLNTRWLSGDCLPGVGTRKMPEKGNKRPSLHLEGWDGAQVGGSSRGRGYMYTYGWFSNCTEADSPVVQEKPTGHCKAVILQLKIKNPPSGTPDPMSIGWGSRLERCGELAGCRISSLS